MANDNEVIKDPTIIYELYNEIFTGLKNTIEDNKSLYGCLVFKQEPTDTHFPQVQLPLPSYRPIDWNLTFNERKYQIDLKVEVYTEDVIGKTKQEVGIDIATEVEHYLVQEIGFISKMNQPMLNIDNNVHRIYMLFSGWYDLDKKIVYRK